MKLFESVSRGYGTRKWEFVFELLFLVTIFIVFWPLTRWVFNQSVGHQQFLQALMVMVTAGYFILLRNSPKLSMAFLLDKATLAFFGVSLVILFIGSVSGWSFVAPLAFCTALAGGCRYFFGKRVLKHVYPLLIVFFLYMMLMILYPVLDFPLRVFGGLFLGSVGNLIRIVIIILLAPILPNHYQLMHETVGLVVFIGTLFSIGWLLWRGSDWLSATTPEEEKSSNQ